MKKTIEGKSEYDLVGSDEKHLNKLNDRFTRWHEKQITLMTFCINLLFTLSVVTIGFIINNIDKPILQNKFIGSCSLPQTTAFIVVLSSLLGISALTCRLFDFRYTKNTIRARTFLFKVKNKIKYQYSKELTEKELNDKIEKLNCRTECLGCATWWLFLLQTVFYLTAVIIVVCKI